MDLRNKCLVLSCLVLSINLHIKYGSNPIRIFLSYREKGEMYVEAADVDADAAA